MSFIRFFMTCSFLLLIAPSLSAQGLYELPLDEAIFESADMEFTSHEGKGPFATYVVQELPFEPINDLRLLLAEAEQEEDPDFYLKTRGEAHITVITPVEYKTILEPFIKIDEINEIALEMGIQEAEFDIVCLGRGQSVIDIVDEETGEKFPSLEQTFYVVVESDDLVEIRREIFRAYLDADGEPSHFDPENYYPHITVGYTERDLYDSDGILKGPNSWYVDLFLTH